MKKKSAAAWMLSVCLILLMFAGCGANEKQGSDQTHGDRLTILGTEGWAPCNDWSEVEQYGSFQQLKKMLEDKNLAIEWEVVPADKYQMLLQTRLSGNRKLPDIIKANGMDDSTLMLLAQRGIIVPINEIVEQYSEGPAREAFDHTYPLIRPLTTAEDGNIYWFCNVQKKRYKGQDNCDGSFTIQYRKDWADRLGIEEPKTLEEFTQMLRAFREQDANGNGEKDEILFVDCSSFRTAIAQWFDLGTGTLAIDPQNKKAVSPWKQPHVKEYFTYLNQLVQEGIISIGVSGNYDLLDQLRRENRVAAIWDYPDVSWNDTAVQAIEPNAFYMPLMPLDALEGVKPAVMSEPGNFLWERFVVTKDCKNPQAVARLLDLVFSDEYKLLTAYGQEGVNYTRDENGKIKLIPGLTFEKLKEERSAEGAILWNGVLPRIQDVDVESRSSADPLTERRSKVASMMIGYDKKYPDQIENYLAVPTQEEAVRINELQNNLEIASKELALKLVSGIVPMSEFDNEVEKLDRLGLEELLAITQARYERYLEKIAS